MSPNKNGVPSENYFVYDASDCTVSPSDALVSNQRSRALRTLYDIGLGSAELAHERADHIEHVKTYLANKGTRRRAADLVRLMARHESRTKDGGAYGEPPVRFTGLVLFAYDNNWLTS